MRLFTALDLPAATVHRLEELLNGLRPLARIHWSPAANLHITTKFIGEWPEARIGELQAALSSIELRGPVSVHVRRAAFFPNPPRPRVFLCGVEAPGLEALATATDRATSALGIPEETRAFSPHLTLARVTFHRNGDRVELESLREAIAALPSLDFGSFEADRFFLYRSALRPSGSVYTKLAEFPLTLK